MGIVDEALDKKSNIIDEALSATSPKGSIVDEALSYGKSIYQSVAERYEKLHQPTEKPASFGEFVTRVIPESAAKTAVGIAEFPFRFGYGIGEQIQKKGIEQGSPLLAIAGVGEEISKNILGAAEFIGEPLGLYGLEAFKRKWSTDPVGALVAVAPLVKAGTVSAKAIREHVVKNQTTKIHQDIAKEVAPEPVADVEKQVLPAEKEISPVAESVKPVAAVPSIVDEALGAPTPEKGLFPGQDKFALISPETEAPFEEFTPIPAEQPLLYGTEKAYRDVGMVEKPSVPESSISEQIDSLRSILPDFELGKRLWNPDGLEVIGSTPNMYPPWFKAVFPNDTAKQVMAAIDKWKKGGDEVLGKKEARIMASVKDLAKDAISRSEDIGESYWREMFSTGPGSYWGEGLRGGPGAKTLGTAKETPPDIVQLTQTISSVTTPAQSLSDRLGIAQSISTSLGKSRDAVSRQLDRMKGISAALLDAIRKPSEFKKTIEERFAPKIEDYKDLLGDYLLSRTKTGIEATRFAKEINRIFPKDRQEAMRKWYLADGNPESLKTWADGIDDPALKKMYQDALTLTPEEQRIARNIRQYHDAKLQEAIDAGILSQGVDNYIRRTWKKENSITKGFRSEVNAGVFRKNPSLLKKRFYETEFEAEKAGLRQKDYRIGFSVTSYDIDFNEALATRAAIAKGFNGKASDGRPLFAVSGVGKQIIDPEAMKSKYVIRPQIRPEEAHDYRMIDHPAMREWKWVENDEAGNPILIHGHILVHPEIYRRFRAVLERSKIREIPVIRNIFAASREFKNTLLSLSGFHQVQIGTHALFHKVNPFKAPEIDLDNPVQANLVRNGLQIYSHSALAEFGEGLYSSGLINRLPGIGTISQKYGSYLFENYIPRQKMQMALAALERNFERYRGKLTDRQIYEKTADQANAAFAEQNYQWIGRHPTVQDMLRIVLLAPDFLEARIRFVGQAISPYGIEQAAALIRGAAGMYLASRVFNQVLDNDPHWDKPFEVVVNGKAYSLRSIPGDLQHLFSDPRSFVYWRLNPTVAKPVVELLSKRDVYGRERTFFQQVEDFFTQQAPIPLQGLFSGKERTLWQSLLQSIGISSWTPRTPAEREALELSSQNLPKGPITSGEKQRIKAKSQIREMLRKGEIAEAKKLAQKHDIDLGTLIRLEYSAKHPLLSSFKNLTASQAARVWEKANAEERKEIRNSFYTKILSDKKMSKEEKLKYIRLIKKYQ